MNDTEAGALGFSPGALHERYRIERERRLRDDGLDQYRGLGEEIEGAEADPFSPQIERAPVQTGTDVVIIGGGFGGLLTAIRLHQSGIRDIRIVEKGSDFGGTWYWNRYPGAACDVESYIYLPMLEETGYVPTERYAKAGEIFDYCRQLGRSFDLYDRAMFQTEVVDVRWDGNACRWHVATTRGDRLSARFVVIAGGVLHKPKVPAIPGLSGFRGRQFHTSRWDYGYTGGTPGEAMTHLADKRVGIIGTGATAIQAIPPLARSAGHLYVFQRTPSSVARRDNAPTDPEWFGGLLPGWQRERQETFTRIVSGGEVGHDMIDDGWTRVFKPQTAAMAASPAQAEEARQLADYASMEAIRRRVDEVVADPAIAEALKPYYNHMCKRPCFHDGFLDTFNRANVTLVDTAGKGIERVTPDGVVVGGREYPLDCLIYASGFEAATAYTRRLGFDIHGRGGIPLSQAWEDGAATLHGFMSRGFPNLLKISTTQGGQAINLVHVLEEAARHLAYVISKAIGIGAATVEPTDEAQNEWLNVLLGRLSGMGTFHKECTPGYYNNEGSTKQGIVGNTSFAGNALDFFAICEEWRRADDFAGLEVTMPDGNVADTTGKKHA